MLLGDLLSEDVYRAAASVKRRALLEMIVADFQMAFPEIRYELRLEFRIINAQAVTFGDERCVIMYGGLGYLPDFPMDALVFVLLHETGHHLAPGRRLPCYRSLACECESDHWAVTEGADILKARSGRSFRAPRAMKELSAILGIGDKGQSDQDDITFRGKCWNTHWRRRRRAILEKAGAPEAAISCNG